MLEFILGAIAAEMGIMIFLLLRSKDRRKERESENEKPEENNKGEESEMRFEITKSERPTREQQYINMLLYDGQEQREKIF